MREIERMERGGEEREREKKSTYGGGRKGEREIGWREEKRERER